MKPIIGVVTRPILSEEKNEMYGVYKDIIQAVLGCGGIPVGLLPLEKNREEVLTICDGIIFQGGDESENYEKEYLEYAYNLNIPCLGICLGMQLMATVFEGNLINVSGHKIKDKNYVHEVFLDKSSKLYSFLQEEKILVNSRHNSAVEETNLDIIAKSPDGIIEAIEDKNKKFFIGLQWHPESMIAYDKVAYRIFEQFIEICRK